MADREKRIVNLPEEQAAYVDRMVESGAYASATEVVGAGLRALQDRDAAFETWLHEEVAPIYDAMASDPSRAIGADEAFARLRARHYRTNEGGG
jgi:antitoxin ParD1/3/4